MKSETLISQDVLNLIGNKISQHAKLYPNIPIKDVYFESIISSSLGCDWKPMNHSPNQDLNTDVTSMKKPSLKGGTIHNGFLTISSHRTTTYPTLQDKIEFLNSREYDSYLCLSREKNSDKVHKYKLIYFSKHVTDWNSLIWTNTYNKQGKQTGFHGKNTNETVSAKIVFNMSHQVWIDVDMNLTTILQEYEY